MADRNDSETLRLRLEAAEAIAAAAEGLSGGRRVMDKRLSSDFLHQMTRRYGLATLVQIAAIPIATLTPRAGVAVALTSVAFFLLPQPRPRYKPDEEPSVEEAVRS